MESQKNLQEITPQYESSIHGLGHGHDVVLDTVDELDLETVDALMEQYSEVVLKYNLKEVVDREDCLGVVLIFNKMIELGASDTEAITAVHKWLEENLLDTRLSKFF